MFRDLDGEAVLLELGTGRYYSLNETGTRMWILLQEHGSVEAALPTLLDEYDVAEERLRKELHGFIGILASQDLLQAHEI
jgi:hypothetical protein